MQECRWKKAGRKGGGVVSRTAAAASAGLTAGSPIAPWETETFVVEGEESKEAAQGDKKGMHNEVEDGKLELEFRD